MPDPRCPQYRFCSPSTFGSWPLLQSQQPTGHQKSVFGRLKSALGSKHFLLVSRVLGLCFSLLLQVAIEESGHQEWELPSWQDTPFRGPWALQYGTQALLHCWVMLRGCYQDFARSDVYAMFYHWQFARGFQLVPNQSPKTGVLETHRGCTELSLLASELILEAELAVHTAS